MRIVVGVGSFKQAQDAVQLGVDALSLTGNEGGGHGVASSPPVKELVTQVSSWLARQKLQRSPLLFAAGGLANGYEAKKLLNEGAHAVVFGTRFLLTHEATYTKDQKDLLIRAGTKSPGVQGNLPAGPTVRSKAFDVARGISGWPQEVDGRGLYSSTVADFDAGKDAYLAYKLQGGDFLSRVVTWAGTGIDRMDQVESASILVQTLADEILDSDDRPGI